MFEFMKKNLVRQEQLDLLGKFELLEIEVGKIT